MGTFPFGYQPIEPTTWAYVSSLLMLALFFKFNRFWSFRNFDLVLIVLLAPGLLMVNYGLNPPQSVVQRFSEPVEQEDRPEAAPSNPAVVNSDNSPNSNATDRQTPSSAPSTTDLSRERGMESKSSPPPQDEPILGSDDQQSSTTVEYTPLQVWQRSLQHRGYLWLFGVGTIWLIRMLIDPSLRRKPFLESNLSSGGLVFLVCSLMIFLFANIVISRPQSEDLAGAKGAVGMVQGNQQDLQQFGPGYALFHLFPTIPTFMNDAQMLREDTDKETATKTHKYEVAAKIMAIASQIAIVLALVFFGKNHFEDLQIGVGMAAIYLMLPYTAQMTGRVIHLLPAALLVWSLTLHRIPFAAGVLLGLAATVAYYPLFLIPLFVSFYWFQGRSRFISGLTLAIGLGVASLFFTSDSWGSFAYQLQAMFGFWLPNLSKDLEGIWSLGWPPVYRIPFIAGFFAMCVSFAFWPAVKNLGTLISCSCAAMIAVQFWHGFGGGLYMGWYLPLALLVIFRPNLEDRVAETVVRESKRSRKSESEPAPELTAA